MDAPSVTGQMVKDAFRRIQLGEENVVIWEFQEPAIGVGQESDFENLPGRPIVSSLALAMRIRMSGEDFDQVAVDLNRTRTTRTLRLVS